MWFHTLRGRQRWGVICSFTRFSAVELPVSFLRLVASSTEIRAKVTSMRIWLFQLWSTNRILCRNSMIALLTYRLVESNTLEVFKKKIVYITWCVFLCNLTKVLKDMEWSCAENPLDLPYCLIWRDMNTTATFTSEEAPKLVTTIRNWPNEQKSVQPAEPSTVNCRQMRASMQTTISAEFDHYMWESRHFAMVHICRSFSTFTVRSPHPGANASLQWNYHLKIMKQACFI